MAAVVSGFSRTGGLDERFQRAQRFIPLRRDLLQPHANGRVRQSAPEAAVLQDLRLAIRSLRATPVVTFVAVLSLALGIGANAAIFSLVDRLVLRSLPVREPARLAPVATNCATQLPAELQLRGVGRNDTAHMEIRDVAARPFYTEWSAQRLRRRVRS
jgi:hypothetical protein